ncbi:hypothetical protein DM48_8114 [Burkholderia gladioli]|uniref:Uncharacterized protein n=1 Tax=Burkholderia gladioli TaxID=28095 RepID=A0AAW3FBM1_BURGA|nr:hypothetical protein DM48_8114 [Burkholderia gladioli]
MTTRQRIARVSRILDHVPAGLHEQPFLRVDPLRLARRQVEEQRIEIREAFDEATPLAVAEPLGHRPLDVLAIEAVERPAFGRDLGDAVASLAQVLPVRVQVRRLRVAARQANDRDAFAPRSLAAGRLRLGGRGRRHRGAARTPPSARDGHRTRLHGRRHGGRAQRRRHSQRSRRSFGAEPRQAAQRITPRGQQVVDQADDGPVFEEHRAGDAGEAVLDRVGQLHYQDRIDPVTLERLGHVDPLRRQFQRAADQLAQPFDAGLAQARIRGRPGGAIGSGRRRDRHPARRRLAGGDRLATGGRHGHRRRLGAACRLDRAGRLPRRCHGRLAHDGVAMRDDDPLPDLDRLRGQGDHLDEPRLGERATPALHAERRRAGQAQLGILVAPPALEQAEAQMREQAERRDLVEQQQAAGCQRGLRMRKRVADVPGRMQHVRRDHHLVGTDLDALRARRLFDIEDPAVEIRRPRGIVLARMHQERLRHVGVGVGRDPLAIRRQRLEYAPAGPARSRADLQDADRARRIARQQGLDVAHQMSGQQRVEVIGCRVVLVDVLDQRHRRVREHHVGRARGAAEDGRQRAQHGIDQPYLGTQVGVGEPAGQARLPARPGLGEPSRPRGAIGGRRGEAAQRQGIEARPQPARIDAEARVGRGPGDGIGRDGQQARVVEHGGQQRAEPVIDAPEFARRGILDRRRGRLVAGQRRAHRGGNTRHQAAQRGGCRAGPAPRLVVREPEQTEPLERPAEQALQREHRVVGVDGPHAGQFDAIAVCLRHRARGTDLAPPAPVHHLHRIRASLVQALRQRVLEHAAGRITALAGIARKRVEPGKEQHEVELCIGEQVGQVDADLGLRGQDLGEMLGRGAGQALVEQAHRRVDHAVDHRMPRAQLGQGRRQRVAPRRIGPQVSRTRAERGQPVQPGRDRRVLRAPAEPDELRAVPQDQLLAEHFADPAGTADDQVHTALAKHRPPGRRTLAAGQRLPVPGAMPPGVAGARLGAGPAARRGQRLRVAARLDVGDRDRPFRILVRQGADQAVHARVGRIDALARDHRQRAGRDRDEAQRPSIAAQHQQRLDQTQASQHAARLGLAQTPRVERARVRRGRIGGDPDHFGDGRRAAQLRGQCLDTGTMGIDETARRGRGGGHAERRHVGTGGQPGLARETRRGGRLGQGPQALPGRREQQGRIAARRVGGRRAGIEHARADARQPRLDAAGVVAQVDVVAAHRGVAIGGATHGGPHPRAAGAEQVDPVDREQQHGTGRRRLVGRGTQLDAGAALQRAVEQGRMQQVAMQVGKPGFAQGQFEQRLAVSHLGMHDGAERAAVGDAARVEHGITLVGTQAQPRALGPQRIEIERGGRGPFRIVEPADLAATEHGGLAGLGRVALDLEGDRAVLVLVEPQMHADRRGLDRDRLQPGQAPQRDGQRRQQVGLARRTPRRARHLHVGRTRKQAHAVDDMFAQEEFLAVELAAEALAVEVRGIAMQQRMQDDERLVPRHARRLRFEGEPEPLARERISGQRHAPAPAAVVQAPPVEVDALDPQIEQARIFALVEPGVERATQIVIGGERVQRVLAVLVAADIVEMAFAFGIDAAHEAVEFVDGFGDRAGHQGEPMLEGFTAHLQRVGDIGQVRIRPTTLAQRGEQAFGHLPQLPLALGRQHQRRRLPLTATCRLLPQVPIFLHDQVRIRTARSERRDRRDARALASLARFLAHRPRPRRQRRLQPERRATEIDVRIRPLRVQARHQLPVTHLQQHLGQPGDPRRALRVPDVRLRRADRAARPSRIAIRLRQPRDLDRIAQLRARAVRLHVTDVACLDPRLRQRRYDQLRCAPGFGTV